jgi:adenylate cyclase
MRQFLLVHWVVGLGLLLATLAWAGQYMLAPDWLSQVEERSGDLAWRLSAEHKDERRLIIVDIDERSLRQIGPWPWPRSTIAQLMQQLAAVGVSQQIYDIVFTDPRPGDNTLTRAAQVQKPVLSQVFALEQGGNPSTGKPAGALAWQMCPTPFIAATGHIANIAGLAAPYVGHITPRISIDGLVRHQPAIICYEGKSYPALGLAAIMAGFAEPELSLQRGTHWMDAPWRLTAPGFAKGIPLNERGDLRVAWQLHPDSFISISAADVLSGQVPASVMEKAWVLVGSTAFGLNDSISTPFEGATGGLQVHAQVIAALLDERTPYTPRAAYAYQVIVLFSGLVMLIYMRRRQHAAVYLMPLAGILWGGVLWLIHALLLTHMALWVGWVNPAFYVAVAGFSLGVLEHAKSRIDRDRLYTHLSSYLPAPVAAALARQSPSSNIKANTQQVSVMFADIRNFSAYLDARPPEEAAAVLHTFFSVATRVVQTYGGVIEAFQGDAVLAVWNGQSGTPETDTARHAQQALQAAITLQKNMAGVLPDPAPAGLEPLALGIGVETGPAMVGSFGLASRRTHMVMGRTVTVASRLVEMTSELAHPILVGEGLAAQIGAIGLESMGTFLLDGMRVPHHIYAYPLVAPHQNTK